MGLPTTTVLGSTFRGADLEAQLAVTARQAVGGLPSGSLQAAKDAIDKTVVNVLHTYRRHCATDTSPGQLILPEALKLLPLYTLAMQKMACFRCFTDHLPLHMYTLHHRALFPDSYFKPLACWLSIIILDCSVIKVSESGMLG